MVKDKSRGSSPKGNLERQLGLIAFLLQSGIPFLNSAPCHPIVVAREDQPQQVGLGPSTPLPIELDYAILLLTVAIGLLGKDDE